MKKYQSLGRVLDRNALKKISGGNCPPGEICGDDGQGAVCTDKKCGGGDRSPWTVSCKTEFNSCVCSSSLASWSNC